MRQTIDISILQEDQLLKNLKNYYVYADTIANREPMHRIYVPDITVNNVNDHIDAVISIMRDGIESDYIHNFKIEISWGGDISCRLFIVDYWINLFMWSMILINGEKILPKHVFYQKELRRKHIKKYVDTFILTKENKIRLGNEFLNNNLCDGLWNFVYTELFAYYLANTINNEDFLDLMNASPRFNEIMHCDLTGVPLDKVKSAGQALADEAIEIIKDSKRYIGYDHGLANSFRANEAVNPRQFKESYINIGTKPSDNGVYPYIINKSFANGGLDNPLSYFIEANSARKAQIISKKNVGDSGDLARIIGLNNIDTILNFDKNYECMSQNYVKFDIKTKSHLVMAKNRYYRMNPRGMDRLIDEDDDSLIGSTIYLHSPMTCASRSQGKGICKRCYGDLYYTNLAINIGKIAAEILTSQITQNLLSAKHLSEADIIAIVWNTEFEDWFQLDANCIRLADISDDIDLRKITMIIDPESITLVTDEDDAIAYEEDEDSDEIEDLGIYNEYITHFTLKMPNGQEIVFKSEGDDAMYISNDLNNIIRRKATNDDQKVNIPLSNLVDQDLFYISINNNEMTKTMNDIINIINKTDITMNMSMHEALQTLTDMITNTNINIDLVHLEVILANQIVDATDILKKVNWNDPHAQYKLLTLDKALSNNPSVIVSLLYKDLNKVLYNPLTFKKNAPSFFDLFFMEQPQNYIDPNLIIKESPIKAPDKRIDMVRIVDKK